MKKLLISIILFMAMAGSATAQDLIVTREGRDIQAKVVEVTGTGIRYLDFENQNGPTYTLNKSDVVLIRYQNGKNEVFTAPTPAKQNAYRPNTTADVTLGMRYKEYKHLYDYHQYARQFGDPYNPTLAGIASFFVPGLGQAICDQWGSAACFFAVDLVGTFATIWIASRTTGYHTVGIVTAYMPLLMVSGITIANGVVSIVDAVRVAKTKNMYFQDIRARQEGVCFEIAPSLSYVNVPSGQVPAIGLSFHVNF